MSMPIASGSVFARPQPKSRTRGLRSKSGRIRLPSIYRVLKPLNGDSAFLPCLAGCALRIKCDKGSQPARLLRSDRPRIPSERGKPETGVTYHVSQPAAISIGNLGAALFTYVKFWAIT